MFGVIELFGPTGNEAHADVAKLTLGLTRHVPPGDARHTKVRKDAVELSGLQRRERLFPLTHRNLVSVQCENRT